MSRPILRKRRAAIVKGKRLARDYRHETRRPERAGHQPIDGIRSQDGEEVFGEAGDGTTLRTSGEGNKQTGPAQGVSGRPAEGGCVERTSAAAGVAAARVRRRLHHFERLAAAATSSGDGDGSAAV